MKIMKKALCLMLSLLMVFSSVVFAGAENEAKAADAVTGFTDEDFIVVKGRKLYNKKGVDDTGPDVETDMEPDDSEDD